jgi:hypothetical protein
MPRPATAQVAYGSVTVVLSTLALLLLSGARSGAAVVAVAIGGLALGLLTVSALVLRDRRVSAVAADAGVSAGVPTASLPVPRARVVGGASGTRVSEHSLRR